VPDNVRLRRIGWLLAAVTATLVAGTVGFRETLHESWFQSLYRAGVTVTLTGLDSVPANNASRIISLLLVAAGLTIIGYAGAVIVEAITGGVVSGALAERRRERTIERLRDHYIICGYGRVGRRVAEEFRAADEPYVVLDFHEDAVASAQEDGVLLLEGDATRDENLRKAGLERARGLVAASDSDADNLYVVLSARSARPELTIVARASGADAERKLRLAGADRVVLPYTTAGRVMANLALKPQVTEFLDVVTTATGPDLQLAEIEVRETSTAPGRTIRELRIRHETGALVVALRKPDGSFDTTPEPDTPFEVGDVLIGVGSPDEIQALEDLFGPHETVAG
jgi:voltage-gated potassium channel